LTDTAAASATSNWRLFANLTFVVILTANTVSAVGDAMYDTSISWLMTTLNKDPLMVSLVQVSMSLPMFFLTLPAGALTDVVNLRKLLLVVEGATLAISCAFDAALSLGLVGPGLLLTATFLLGAASSLAAPAWMLVPPLVVPPADVGSAVALNGAGYNLSRAIGPALAGLLIAAFSVKLPFWFYALGNGCVVATLIWWRAPPARDETLPAERLVAALRAGVRYSLNSPEMIATLIRTLAFFPFACAFWALLPLIAASGERDGAAVYGVLMGVIGVGSIVGSFGLNRWKTKFGPDRLAAGATGGTILALVLFGAADGPALAILASFIGGASWVVMMTSLFMSAQVALPEWVQGRGIAVYLTTYFGAATVGAAIWGKTASLVGVSNALYLSAGCTLIGLLATQRWKLQTGAGRDLTPSLHWREPAIATYAREEQGPVLATVEYSIDPKDRAPFLALMKEIGRERKRDGAYAWNVFEDPLRPGIVVEACLLHSVLELKYARARVTKADQLIEQKAWAFLKAPPKPLYLIAVKEHERPENAVEAPKPAA